MKFNVYSFIYAILVLIILYLANFNCNDWEGWLIMFCTAGISVCGYKQGKTMK